MYDGTIRDGLPPIPATAPKRIEVPAGAWETHAHVIGPDETYPWVESRHFNPQVAPVEDFVAMLDTVGLTYGVLIQVSVHGTDNRVLVDALRAYPGRLRGIAVADPSFTDSALAELNEAGVRGVRLLDIVGGGVDIGGLERMAAICAELGWHIQLGMRGEGYPALIPRLTDLEVPFVIDHMGWCPPAEGPGGEGFRAVEYLARNARCYVKLSGAFRISGEGPPWADTFVFGRRLVEAAPDRMLWGSDWPHVGLYDPAARPDVGALLDGLADYAPDEAQRNAILTTNPERLFDRPS
ncbi:amidohydrolase family protein [Aquicoccus sp. SCR17]|nr:amidohydrolase family protein [Carideicomes alvinocaridis]